MNPLDSLKQMLLKAAAYLTARQQQQSVSPITPSQRPQNALGATERLYAAAYLSLGKDLSKWAPNERGCAESASRVIESVYPDFPVVESTITLTANLINSPHFQKTDTPKPGTVTVFPTQGGVVGHCGIWGKHYVMNNNSATGKWEASYTFDQWYAAARNRGLRLYFYDPV